MVNTAGWPAKLLMQYIPKAFVAAVRPATDLLAKTVLVEFDQPLSPQVQQMTRVLDGGYVRQLFILLCSLILCRPPFIYLHRQVAFASLERIPIA